MIRLTVELTPAEAAGLKRLTEKVAFSEAMAVLYPHVSADIRGDQVAQIMSATCKVFDALGELAVRTWPWIDTGRP